MITGGEQKMWVHTLTHYQLCLQRRFAVVHCFLLKSIQIIYLECDRLQSILFIWALSLCDITILHIQNAYLWCADTGSGTVIPRRVTHSCVLAIFSISVRKTLIAQLHSADYQGFQISSILLCSASYCLHYEIQVISAPYLWVVR